MKYLQLHGLKTVCMLVCVLMYVGDFMCMCLRTVGEGLKLKGSSQNKDMESCSLESISLILHFLQI